MLPSYSHGITTPTSEIKYATFVYALAIFQNGNIYTYILSLEFNHNNSSVIFTEITFIFIKKIFKSQKNHVFTFACMAQNSLWSWMLESNFLHVIFKMLSLNQEYRKEIKNFKRIKVKYNFILYKILFIVRF